MKKTTVFVAAFVLGVASEAEAQVYSLLTHAYFDRNGQYRSETMPFRVEHRFAIDLLRGRDIEDVRRQVSEFGTGNAFEVRRRQEEIIEQTIQFHASITETVLAEISLSSFMSVEYSQRDRGRTMGRILDYDFDRNYFPVQFLRRPSETFVRAEPVPMTVGSRVLGFDASFPDWMVSEGLMASFVMLPFDSPTNAERFQNTIGDMNWTLGFGCTLLLQASWDEANNREPCVFKELTVNYTERSTDLALLMDAEHIYRISWDATDNGIIAQVEFAGDTIMTFDVLEGPS